MESGRKRAEHRGTPETGKEHVMMFAFALAVIGFILIASLDLVAARP